MKKSNLKYLFASVVVALGVVAVSVYSCEKEVITPNNLTTEGTEMKTDVNIPIPGSICGKIQQKGLIKVNDQEVGEALVYNDTKYFYVQLTTNRGYYMMDANMHICTKFEEIPVDKYSNPDISRFTYSISGKPLSTVRKFRVALTEMNGNSLVTVTVKTKYLRKGDDPIRFERAWVDGRSFGTTEPGRVFAYEKGLCLENQETAVDE